MLAVWVERAAVGRFSPARVALLTALAVGDLALLHHPGTAWDWGLVLTGFLLLLSASVWPLPALLGLSALLGTAGATEAGVVMPVKVMCGIALFELAVRRSGRQLSAGGCALAIAIAAEWVGRAPAEVAPVLFRVGTVMGVPLLVGAYIRSIRESARKAREKAADEERRRLSQTRAVRAAERTAIARELHDLVAHHVSSMVLRVGVARHVLPDSDPRVAEVLRDLHTSGTAALADLRRLVGVLRDPASVHDSPPLIDPGALPAALSAVVENGRKTGLTVDASIDPAVARLDTLRGFTVLRLTQEGMANVAKHAGPSAHARLSVRVESGTVTLRLDNDVDAGHRAGSTTQGGSGHGLTGMLERVELLGGRLAAGPSRSGWSLSAELPALAPEPQP
ncbi:sensor histidine kinase [Actinomadura alba]|uniref:sensor histidine kinase n=1 Tax=Actinomadura alba TaxID=406431 RepID=UPI001C9D5F17|nr:histidine kinase [Actinomadura alba]